MIKIIFFDIDGTLLPLKQTQLSTSLIDALNKLKEKGIKLFLASGRPKFSLPDFQAVDFDGALTFNGQHCFDKTQVLYDHPMDPEEVKRIYQNAREMNAALTASQLNQLYCDRYDQKMEEYFQIANQKLRFIDDFSSFLEKPIYQMMAAIPESLDQELLQDTNKIQIVRWWPYACDLIPASGGKGKAVKTILEKYGIQKEEAMAFGDGGNDIEMLKAVGLSIAMGNAVDRVKENCIYTTRPVEEEGVVYALKHFELL
ncbi:Cof-type HAD-IIB family hydrolase [uncultured Faecalicoccus sp.]|uniref:Cof-type HAD-IIB family hydrolase n=1 Tax=uncultured Faecalicoccus sp. TaxID=1971760 RepID=UPI00261DE232|nr:Cof-type HAD-IIB family hydrolase [uncultured Faecalicoccus sp.]